MKMMKSAILTASILASATVFAGNASVNVGANAQVESGGLLSRIGNGVKSGVTDTAHAVHSTAVKATDATVDAGSHVAHKTHDFAVDAKDKTVNIAEKAGDKSEQAWQNTKQGTKNTVKDVKNFSAEEKAKAESRWDRKKQQKQTSEAQRSGVKANSQVGVNVGSVNANAGVDANVSPRNVGVQTQIGVGR